MTATISGWQQRRSRYNHDWLKNRYLNNLDGFITMLEDSTPDKKHVLDFLKEDWRQWEDKKAEAQWLMDNFEEEMSPCIYFNQAPLNSVPEDTKKWFKPFVHSLWLFRYRVKEKIFEQEDIFQEACTQFKTVDGKLKTASSDLEKLQGLLPEFKAFRQSCFLFSRLISQLPSEVMVV